MTKAHFHDSKSASETHANAHLKKTPRHRRSVRGCGASHRDFIKTLIYPERATLTLCVPLKTPKSWKPNSMGRDLASAAAVDHLAASNEEG